MQNAPQRMNKSATRSRTRAKSAQVRSRAVRDKRKKQKASPAVRNLIVFRGSIGANTRRGHVASDLIEEIENWQIAKATGNALQLANLAKLMPPRMAIISSHISQ